MNYVYNSKEAENWFRNNKAGFVICVHDAIKQVACSLDGAVKFFKEYQKP